MSDDDGDADGDPVAPPDGLALVVAAEAVGE